MCWRTQLLWTNSGEVMKLWPCGFKIEYTHRGFASAVAVWLGIWSSHHVVLKSSIRTLASPWPQRSHWGLRVTQDGYFSMLSHIKQPLLVTRNGNSKVWRTLDAATLDMKVEIQGVLAIRGFAFRGFAVRVFCQQFAKNPALLEIKLLKNGYFHFRNR